jgi:signal transduction histidine kinase
MLPAVLWRHACALQELGAWRSARLEFEAAIRMSAALGDLRNEALARLNLCILLIGEGSVAKARAELEALQQRLEGSEEEIDLKPDVEKLAARIAIAAGSPIWDRQQTLRVLAEPEPEEAELLPDAPRDERIGLGLKNALLAGYDLSGTPELEEAVREVPEDRVIRLLAIRAALPPDREDEESLAGLVDELRKEAVDSEVAQATELLLDIAVQLEGYGFRAPGHLVEHATDLAKKAGLPGLLWRASLAGALKALRHGDQKSGIRGLGRALEGFASCYLGKGSDVPPPVRRLPGFQAIVQAIQKLLTDLRVEPDSESALRADARSSILHLQLCLSELALEAGSGGVQAEGKWARGIERILSVTETLNSTRQLDRLLAQIVDSVLDLSDAEHGFVVLLDDSGEPTVRVARGMFGEADHIEGRVSQTVVKRVLAGRRALLIKNALDELDLVAQPSVRSLSLRSIMCAPMSHQGELYGVIFVDNRSAVGSFTDEDLRLLEVFANHAAIALVNSRLVEDLEHSYEELAEAHEGILRSEKLKSLGVLAGGIAHDFNNLLMGILGNADLALEHLPPEARAGRFARSIKKEAQRAADLCRELLAYSGKGQFVIEPIDLSDVVEDMTELLRLSIAKKAVVAYRLDPALPAVEADVTQIRQIIMNLVINASEALEEGEGEITVATGSRSCDREYLRETYLGEGLPEGTYVYFEVSDTGCGLDEAARARLFEPFFTTKFTGRGLGLSAVLGIVRGHQGTIDIRSEPGRGTRMRVLFPSSDRLAPAGSAEEEPTRGDLGGGTVLVVDDEPSVREIAAEMMRTLGFRVITAADGRSALEEFGQRAEEIELVLLDMTMPRMSGEEAFREIQKLRADARVILSSGYDEQEAVRRMTAAGLTGFLQKPYSLSDLRSAVHQALAEQD